MKIAFLFSLIISLCKGGAWIGLGLLLRDHFDSLITLVTRRDVQEDRAQARTNDSTMKMIKFIGLLFIILGIAIMVMGLYTVIAGSRFGFANLDMKF